MVLAKVVFMLAACTATVYGSTIAELAIATPALSTLVTVLGAADLVDTFDGPGNFTVFAPTNDAFGELGSLVTTLGFGYNSDVLTGILTHHALTPDKLSTDFTTEPETMLNGQNVTVSLIPFPSVTSAAGTVANISTADIPATNGVVHIISKVLLPTGLPAATVMTLADSNLPTLAELIDAAGLRTALETATANGYTVLAPSEQAFVNALAALNLTKEELKADVPTLTSILTYHVIPVYADANAVTASIGQELNTLNGNEVTISSATTVNENVSIVQTDLRAFNGVVHVIDAVLLPPEDDDSTASPTSLTLGIAAAAAGLLAALI